MGVAFDELKALEEKRKRWRLRNKMKWFETGHVAMWKFFIAI